MALLGCIEQQLTPAVQVMDFGYPQFTEAKILSEFIKTDAHKMEVTGPPRSTVGKNTTDAKCGAGSDEATNGGDECSLVAK